MADNAQTTTTLANDTPTEWFRAELLERSERYEVFTKCGVQVTLPSGQGDTVQFVRYERPALPGVLSEGVTPDGQDVALSKVTAAVDQHGGYFTLTDTAILQTFHGPFEQVAELAGQQYGSVRDREAQRVLRRATSIFYAANRANRAALTTTDYMTTGDAIRVLESLRAKGAPSYNDGLYAVIIPTNVEADMLNDATWVNTKVQQDQGPLERGEVMRWMGAKFVRSNQIPGMVLNTGCNPASITTPAASGAETALAGSSDYYINCVAVDRYGQEFAMGTAQATSAFTTGDIIAFSTPAFITGATGYNIYASAAGGAVGTERLQLRGAAASTVYHLTGNGSAASGTGIMYSSAGQLIEPVPTAGVTVFPVFFIGRGYFACIANGSVITTMTAPTTSGRTVDSDPLGQRRKVGWKAWNKDAMLNENFGAILWVASRYTGYTTV